MELIGVARPYAKAVFAVASAEAIIIDDGSQRDSFNYFPIM